MKKFLLIFCLLVLCLLGGFATWFSYSFNPESYRERIIKNLSQMTGRAVEIKGGIVLGWRPYPTLVISDLTVANQSDSKTPVMFSVSQVRAEIEWLSLFKNPLVIKKVVLENPVVLLERLKRYETNFDFPILFKPSNGVENLSFIDPQDAFSLSIREIEVENGRLTYENAITNEKFKLEGINGRGEIASLTGPFSFLGTFAINDQERASIDLRVGQIEVSQPLPIKLILANVSSETEIKMDGKLLQNQMDTTDWLELSGIINSKKSSELLQNFGIKDWPIGDMNGSFTLKLMADETILESTIRITHGENNSDTAFFFGMRPVFNSENTKDEKLVPTLNIVKMDYDKWRPFLSKIQPSFLDKLSGDFQVKLDEVKINNGALTQAIIQGRIEKNTIYFSDLTAQLPSNSSLFFKGEWSPQKQEIKGQIDFQSANLGPFLEWATNKKLGLLSDGTFQNAHLVADLHSQGKDLESNITVGVLDDTQFSGKLNVYSKEKIELTTQLEIKNLNLDKYFKLNSDFLNNLASFLGESTFDVKAENLTLLGYLFNQVNMNIHLQDKIFELKSFSAEGSDHTAIDMTTDFNVENQLIKDLKMQISIPNLDNFNQATKLSLDFPFWSKTIPVQGNLAYTGNLEKGNLEAEFRLDQTDLKLNGTLENPLTDPKVSDAEVSLTEPEIQNVKSIHTLFPDLKGTLKLSLQGDGNFKNFQAKKFSSEIDKQNLMGDIKWDLNQKSVEANLNSSLLDLNSLLPASDQITFSNDTPIKMDVPSDLMLKLQLKADQMLYGKDVYTSSKIVADLKNQELTISDLILHKGETGAFSGTGKVVFKSPMIIEGKLNLENWPIKDIFTSKDFSLRGGFLSWDGNFIMSGNSWNAFGKSLRGQGNLRWNAGQAYGIDLKELSSIIEKSLQLRSTKSLDAQIKHALSNGKTEFNSIIGPIEIEQGSISAHELRGLSDLGEAYLRKFNWLFVENKMNAVLSFILNTAKDLPSVDVELKDNTFIPSTEAFNMALGVEIQSLEKRQKENEEKEALQEIKNKQTEILTRAKEILDSSEKQMLALQNKLALHPSAEAQELLISAKGTLDEVRSVAVLSDLNPEQLSFLQEKADLLNVQIQEVTNLIERKEILRQYEAVKKLSPLVKTRIDDMVRIYNQNPESTLLAGLIQKSQIEQEKIEKNLAHLSETDDLKTIKELIEKIKDSFQKIQKALDYARPFDIGSV